MIALIAAHSLNGVIGSHGKIPWRIKGEQSRFKELTMGNVVVMGRRSFEEIGKPLAGRTTVVVSRTKNFTGDNLYTVSSLEKAIELFGHKDIYISGGERLYKEGLAYANIMYLTVIEKECTGDTFFPSYQSEDWIKIYENRIAGDIPYLYQTFRRKA